MKVLSLVASILFCMIVVEQVQAGPFGVFGRRGCSSGNCGSSYGSQASGGGCSSGNCAIPLVQTEQPSVQQQVMQEVIQHVAETNSSINETISTERLKSKEVENPLVKAFRQKHTTMPNSQGALFAQSLAKTFK